MLRHTISEEPTYPSHYVPVPRKDEMSEGHLEDYLDHFCVPLVGKISYEERSKMREELRSQIESVIAAHIELGSTREQAIAFTLQQFSHVPSVAPVVAPVLQTPAVVAETPVVTRRRFLALKCFGLSTALSFVAAMSLDDARGAEGVLVLLMMMTAVFAGVILGYRQPDRPVRSMLKTLSWMTIPTVIMSWIFTSTEFHGSPFAAGFIMALFYLFGTAILGGIGAKMGKWIRTTGFLDKVDPPYPARFDNGPHRLP